MYDLIVIGGGPAGLTATAYAIRKRLNVLLVSKDLGGKTNFKLHLPWIGFSTKTSARQCCPALRRPQKF